MPACSSCGAALAPDAPACDLCGTPADAREPMAAPTGATCAACGHVSPPGSRFCNACGTPIAEPIAAPPVERTGERPPSDAGKKGLLVVGIGLAAVVALYLLTVVAPRPDATPEPAADAIGAAAPIPPGAPPLPDSLQVAADRFADQGTASGWYESGRYYLTAAFNSVQSDPTSSVRWARRAIEDFEKSLAIAESPAVRVALAEAATFDPSDPMRPIQELRAVLDADPGNLDATYLLAERRMMIGRVDSARVAFERVVAEAPPGSPVRQRAEAALAQIAASPTQ
ncbi:double zinc ribbon domain-containing protein [Rubrivirga sp. IMCC45206]|uniref:double zinc ribbon domain-containing protein n=1 Tax=Rubrivirga sp. IMCC45206 TaxID=3391614 RepID=UPI00398FF927